MSKSKIWDNMWDMTEEEERAYLRFEPAFTWSIFGDDCDRCGLIGIDHPRQCFVTHGLVCMYLNEHKDAAALWKKKEIMYYDVLNAAEQEYLRLPPWKERHAKECQDE